ncbi:MAG: periplasmic heavy metal sensor [Rhodoferax sp.]|nr:periplasmic heavy metal sensor [Rhodoferax sp.]
MQTKFTLKLIAACAILTGATGLFAQHTPSPYAGQQTRSIKALSATQEQDLLQGKGMELAKAAELNGYAGPAHVLELAAALQLDDAQRHATQTLMARHKDKARALGAQLVEAERALDGAFASQAIDAARITDLTQAIGTLQAALRAEHLQTHLEQTALLNPQQIAGYQKLRGYDHAQATTGTHVH